MALPRHALLLLSLLPRPATSHSETQQTLDWQRSRQQSFNCPAGAYSQRRGDGTARLRQHMEAAGRALSASSLDTPWSATAPFFTHESAAWPKPTRCLAQRRLACARHPHLCLQTEWYSRPPAKSIMTSRELGFEYRKVWKVASTSLAAFFGCNGADDGEGDGGAMDEAMDEGTGAPRLKVIFATRDPLGRFVSAIFEILDRMSTRFDLTSVANETLQATYDNAGWIVPLLELRAGGGERATLLHRLVNGFLEDIECSINYHDATHMATQTSFITQGRADKAEGLDMQVKLENLQEDLEAAGRALGLGTTTSPTPTAPTAASPPPSASDKSANTSSIPSSVWACPLDMEEKVAVEKKPTGLVTKDDVKNVLTSDASLMQRLCTVYIQDYICLGYDLPPECAHGRELEWAGSGPVEFYSVSSRSSQSSRKASELGRKGSTQHHTLVHDTTHEMDEALDELGEALDEWEPQDTALVEGDRSGSNSERSRPAFDPQSTICLVTIMTGDRVASLHRLCDAWDGHVSIAYLAMTDRYNQAAAKGLSLLRNADGFLPPVPERITLSVVEDRGYMTKQRFPYNTLRNVALRGCTAEFVLTVDVDFVVHPPQPSAMLQSQLESLDVRAGSPNVLVLPAFEEESPPAQQSTSGVSVKISQHLLSKAELSEGYRNGKIISFASKGFPMGHACDDAPKFLNTTKSYEVRYLFACEPYVILPLAMAHDYDERFVGYGKDRNSWTYELAAKSARLLVSPSAFVVHYFTTNSAKSEKAGASSSSEDADPVASSTRDDSAVALSSLHRDGAVASSTAKDYGHFVKDWSVGETCWAQFRERVHERYNFSLYTCAQARTDRKIIYVHGGDMGCMAETERLCVRPYCTPRITVFDAPPVATTPTPREQVVQVARVGRGYPAAFPVPYPPADAESGPTLEKRLRSAKAFIQRYNCTSEDSRASHTAAASAAPSMPFIFFDHGEQVPPYVHPSPREPPSRVIVMAQDGSGDSAFSKVLTSLVGGFLPGIDRTLFGETREEMQAQSDIEGLMTEYFENQSIAHPYARFIGFKYKPLSKRYGVLAPENRTEGSDAMPFHQKGLYSDIWPWVLAYGVHVIHLTSNPLHVYLRTAKLSVLEQSIALNPLLEGCHRTLSDDDDDDLMTLTDCVSQHTGEVKVNVNMLELLRDLFDAEESEEDLVRQMAEHRVLNVHVHKEDLFATNESRALSSWNTVLRFLGAPPVGDYATIATALNEAGVVPTEPKDQCSGLSDPEAVREFLEDTPFRGLLEC